FCTSKSSRCVWKRHIRRCVMPDMNEKPDHISAVPSTIKASEWAAASDEFGVEEVCSCVGRGHYYLHQIVLFVLYRVF
ncbi:hypothetical protein, partial [Enterobacter cloacae complex sp. 4DZ1-17B1]|uniref:hypothetical protein n=1 Tax=Enterobacter cloacae complex sp. 4DZ1-17B1 TaxID=2511991 RepID=UPI001CA557FB